MKDILKGAVGKLIQIVLTLLGFILLLVGIISGSFGWGLIGAIICWCLAYGINYWLGHIMRMR